MDLLNQRHAELKERRKRLREEFQGTTSAVRRREIRRELEELARRDVELIKQIRELEMEILEDFLKDFDLE